MDISRDFEEMLRGLNDAKARYLVVGAYAVAFHSEPRYTKDLDIWVDPYPDNAARVWAALVKFGAPIGGLKARDFEDPKNVFQIGFPPNRIDVIMGLSGITFAEAWRSRVKSSLGGVPVFVLDREGLLRAKRAAGRPQDLLDVAKILQHRPGSAHKKRKKKR